MKRLLIPSLVLSGAVLLLVGFSVTVLLWGCEYPQGAPHGNAFPTTRLANIPANDTIAQYLRLGAIPEVTLYWLGDDPDGFVVAYRYRWTDIEHNIATAHQWTTVMNIATLGGAPIEEPILVEGNPQSLFALYNFITTLDPVNDSGLVRIIGDSLATRRPFAVPYKTGILRSDSIFGANTDINLTPTTGKFIFDSPIDSNMHKFEVASVDNNNAVDPDPAVVHFWTMKSPGPIVIINAVPQNDLFVIRYPTERFQGLQFAFSTLDPSTFDQQYSWSVDDTVNWSPWSTSGTALVTAISFKPIATGAHTFYARAMNRWGVISLPASRVFTAIVPAIDDPNYRHRALIINNDLNGNRTAGKPDTSQVNAYYSEMMDSLGWSGRYDIWTTDGRTGKAFPPRDMYGNYTVVIVVSEQTLPAIGLDALHKITPEKTALLTEYLNIGGNLIVTGPPDAHKFIQPESFFSQVLHTVSVTLASPVQKDPLLDFVGVKGRLGYPDVPLDPAKIPADSGGALRNVELNYPRGFAQSILTFDSKTNNGQFENFPVGVRYLAPPPVPPAHPTYSVVYFGFPLYYAQKSAAIKALRQAFADLNQ